MNLAKIFYSDQQSHSLSYLDFYCCSFLTAIVLILLIFLIPLIISFISAESMKFCLNSLK